MHSGYTVCILCTSLRSRLSNEYRRSSNIKLRCVGSLLDHCVDSLIPEQTQSILEHARLETGVHSTHTVIVVHSKDSIGMVDY